jgi:hypothetical protein
MSLGESVIGTLAQRIVNVAYQHAYYGQVTMGGMEYVCVSWPIRYLNRILTWLIPCKVSSEESCKHSLTTLFIERCKDYLTAPLSLEGLSCLEKLIVIKKEMPKALKEVFEQVLSIVEREKQQLEKWNAERVALQEKAKDIEARKKRKEKTANNYMNQLKLIQELTRKVAELEAEKKQAAQTPAISQPHESGIPKPPARAVTPPPYVRLTKTASLRMGLTRSNSFNERVPTPLPTPRKRSNSVDDHITSVIPSGT